MGVWAKVRVGALLGAGAGGGRADVDRLWMDGRRDDVQRGGIRRGAAVYVRIRWMMAMRARVRAAVVRRGCARRFLALREPSGGVRDGHIWSAIGIS